MICSIYSHYTTTYLKIPRYRYALLALRETKASIYYLFSSNDNFPTPPNPMDDIPSTSNSNASSTCLPTCSLCTKFEHYPYEFPLLSQKPPCPYPIQRTPSPPTILTPFNRAPWNYHAPPHKGLTLHTTHLHVIGCTNNMFNHNNRGKY